MTNKKALSEIVSYVILIIIALTVSTVVFVYLKGTLWQTVEKCDDGVSLSIVSYNCNLSDHTVSVKMRNNGLFEIQGLLAKSAPTSESLASCTLNPLLLTNSSGDVRAAAQSTARGDYFFNPDFHSGEENTMKYLFLSCGTMQKISLVPIQVKGTTPYLCSSSELIQNIVCA